ncbi:MAG: hypothetical protein ACK58L_03750 [Planctomycetota bacterium]
MPTIGTEDEIRGLKRTWPVMLTWSSLQNGRYARRELPSGCFPGGHFEVEVSFRRFRIHRIIVYV